MIDTDPVVPAVSTFVRCKLGETAESCEDRVAVRALDGTLRIGVSDGATTSSFSAQWADLLTNWFVERRAHATPKAIERVLPVLGSRWLKDVRSRPLPWHAEEKILEGSFATFLGVSVEGGTSLRAIAIGDSCLFHVRADAMLSSFPYETAEQFASRPVLLSTSARANAVVGAAIAHTEFELAPGDLVIAASDGLAQWLMRSHEAGVPRWEIFADTQTLEAVVDEERYERRMRNDDVACAWFTA